jgi:hypothetical protein
MARGLAGLQLSRLAANRGSQDEADFKTRTELNRKNKKNLMASPSTPNLYDLHGHHLHITYSTTSIDGKPRFQYHDQSQALQFSGDQIRTLDSEIGTLVTVTIHLTPDFGSTSFTLLVPKVNLDPSNHAHITTFGVTTLHRFSIAPQLDRGQTEHYTVAELSGTAALVAF